MNRVSIIIIITLFFFITCERNKNPFSIQREDIVQEYSDSCLVINVPKWYNNHKAAVSITYDAAWGMKDDQYRNKLNSVVNEIIKRNMKMDFECVTVLYDKPEYQKYLDQMKNELHPKGIHFFGHGHYHINYDEVSYDSAFASMKKCFKLMTEWGLKPKVYAYPHGACFS